MIAVDTNVLVHAHRRDSPWHAPAVKAVTGLAEERRPWAIPWPCAHEFLAIVTHPRIFNPPSTIDQALDQLAAWAAAPSLTWLSEGHGYLDVLASMVASARVTGARMHDARVAALCVHHGVNELWSADRDFGRFPQMRVRNPLVPS